jgi:hypothetical protein
MPLPSRSTSGSPMCWRSAANERDTAGSLTPSTSAAARTDPSRATSTNAPNCVRVIPETLSARRRLRQSRK